MRLFSPVKIDSEVTCTCILKSKKIIRGNMMVNIEMHFKNMKNQNIGYSSSNLLITDKEEKNV
mgnify:FL=1|tara:strand:- start:129 stop:317 length:189 start_codon:yes stop_codon:yes gene_type:complete